MNGRFSATFATFRRELLDGVDAVVHLAAVSNDPMGNKFEAVDQRNQSAGAACGWPSSRAERGVKNFVFASSCSMYGYAEGGARKETDPTNPLTAYARSKIGTEQAFAADRPRRNGGDVAAVRHRLRHVGPTATRSRAERFRRLRDRLAARSPC